MTDSIKTKIDLMPLSEATRSLISFNITTETDNITGEMIRFIKPRQVISPVSRAKIQVLFECEHLMATPMPVRVYADINLPSALVGQNYLHGTSVYAAGKATLALIKILLAGDGVPREELAKLGAEHVSLQKVTLTSLFDMGTEEKAHALTLQVVDTSELLFPPSKWMKSTNRSVLLERPTFSVKTYNKTDEEHIKWPADAPVDDIRRLGRGLVRVEVVLRESFLKGRGLTALTSWKGARKRGLYKTLFNETVRKVYRLDDDLRHKAPRPEVLAKLTPTERALVRGYLDGKIARDFPAVKNSSRPASAFHRIRKSILTKARLDIDIPWANHQQLDCHLLKDILVEPGNFRPPKDLAPWCFCNANWGPLKARLNNVLEQSIDHAGPSLETSLIAPPADCAESEQRATSVPWMQPATLTSSFVSIR